MDVMLIGIGGILAVVCLVIWCELDDGSWEGDARDEADIDEGV